MAQLIFLYLKCHKLQDALFITTATQRCFADNVISDYGAQRGNLIPRTLETYTQEGL